MYVFLQTSMGILTDSRMERRQIYENKKWDRIKFEIQTKKEKIRSTPNLYDSELSSISEQSETDVKSKTHQTNKTFKSMINTGKPILSKKNDHYDPYSFYSSLDNPDKKVYRISKRLNKYKTIIRGIDVLVTIIAISTMILSQIENHHDFFWNQQLRIHIVKWGECLKNNTKNIPCLKQDWNATHYDLVFNRTDYLDTIDFEEYNVNSIKYKMKIDNFSKIMRAFILTLTIVSIVGVIISRKIEHIREYVYIQKKNSWFYQTTLFYLMLCEVGLLAMIQYPNTTKCFFYQEFGHYVIFPWTTFLSKISLLRVTFIIKLLKSWTRWTDSGSERVCEKYACKADETFAFKAFQKENPFSVWFAVFVMSCICFGIAIQSFECWYWENYDMNEPNYQNWSYMWNAIWFVFVSMTTVGYGDFFPRTQVGRIITIFCCLVGVYFVSSMMVFMTTITVKNEKEEKAFKLITRIQYRKKVRDLQGGIVFYALKYGIAKQEGGKQQSSFMDDFKNTNNNFRLNEQRSSFEDEELIWELTGIKRKIESRIQWIKEKVKYIKTCDLVPIKEQLFDIQERISNDVKNIKFELNFLDTLNWSMKKYTNYQWKTWEYLKKDWYSTKMFYDLVLNNKEVFPVFAKLKMPLDVTEWNIKKQSDSFLKPPAMKLNTRKESMNLSQNNSSSGNNNVSSNEIRNYTNNDISTKVSNLPMPRNHMNGTLEEGTVSQEEDTDLLNTTKYDKKLINQSFGFLFDDNFTTTPKRYEQKKTKIVYRDAFEKVEKLKAAREINSIKTNIIKKYAESEKEEQRKNEYVYRSPLKKITIMNTWTK